MPGLIPEGADSHAFESTSDTARTLSEADVIFLNGLKPEDRRRFAEAKAKDGAEIYQPGPNTIEPDQCLYDFSFPRSGGHPPAPVDGRRERDDVHTKVVRDELVKVDPAPVDLRGERRGLPRDPPLNAAVQQAVDTIPPANRILLTGAAIEID